MLNPSLTHSLIHSGVGDREPLGKACGCPHLLKEVERMRPKYHVMGHIHSDFGVHQVSTSTSWFVRSRRIYIGWMDGWMDAWMHGWIDYLLDACGTFSCIA
jgi:hypothetical protein